MNPRIESVAGQVRTTGLNRNSCPAKLFAVESMTYRMVQDKVGQIVKVPANARDAPSFKCAHARIWGQYGEKSSCCPGTYNRVLI
jgi:hypothetical protein